MASATCRCFSVPPGQCGPDIRCMRSLTSHGWSYHYPPTFAILMGPFADPLPGYAGLSWALPFSASVGVFYALSIAAMVLTAHIWAKALEDHSGIALPDGQSGWWALRIAPVLLLAPYFGASFARGQPTTILILLICIFLKLYADRRVAVASAALALAIAVKIFPAALLLIPLLRRDLGTLAWTAAWCAVFLLALPALARHDLTIELYRTLWIERLSGIAEGDWRARVAVEISPWSNDTVAFGSMLGRTFVDAGSRRPHRLPRMGAFAATRLRSRHRRPDRRAGPRPLLELVEAFNPPSPLCDPRSRRGDSSPRCRQCCRWHSRTTGRTRRRCSPC